MAEIKEMNLIVKQDLIKGLKETINATKENDFFILPELSNHTIHNASIYQDSDSILAAVIIYSLSKIITRERKIDEQFLKEMRKALNELEQGRVQDYRKTMQNLLKIIAQKDSKLKLYIEEVVMQARVKKGMKLYEHGISVGQAADLLGVSQWELMDYIGKTTIPDMLAGKPGVKSRIRFAKEVFHIG